MNHTVPYGTDLSRRAFLVPQRPDQATIIQSLRDILASEAALQGRPIAAPSSWLLCPPRKAVGAPGFGADAVVDEEKAGGIVFFFDGF